MASRSARSRLVCASVLAIAAATPALAQNASDTNPVGSTDIIVTARRTEERLQDVPISITVVNPQQIADRNIVIASDLATYTPSLSVNSQFGPEKATYAIRGFFQSNNTAPTVGVYFNDVVVPRGYAGTLSGSTPPVGSFMDLENIQVLKGPQGTLFGRNTTAGAVLLVPKKPTDRIEGNIEGSVGDYGMWRLQGVLNVPINDTFKIRIAVDHNKRDGYLRNRSGVGPRGFENIDYFAARLGVLADLTPTLQNYTLVTYSDSHTNGVLSRVVECDRGLASQGDYTRFIQSIFAPSACQQLDRQNARGDGPLDVENNAPDPYQKLKNWQISNTTTWLASDSLTIKNTASYSEFRERDSFNLYGDNFVVTQQAANFAGPAGLPLTVGQPYSFVTIGTANGRDAAATAQFTEELQFQGRTSDGRFVWQVGGYFQADRPLGDQTNLTSIIANCPNGTADTVTCRNPLGIGAISDFSDRIRNTNKAVYAQATYKITTQLSLTGGIRYTDDNYSGTVKQGDFKFAPDGSLYKVCLDQVHFPGVNGQPRVVDSFDQCAFSVTSKSHKPTWLIDLDYKPAEDLLLYAKYSRGYRQGGASFGAVGLEAFGPEKLDAYEVGAKASFHGGLPGYINLAAFYNNLTNQQLNGSAIPKDPSISTADPIINAGKSRIQGIEADTQVTLARVLRLNVGYAFLDTKLKSIAPVVLPPASPYLTVVPAGTLGGELAYTPRHRVTVDLNYRLPVADEYGTISVGGTYTYTASQLFSDIDLPQYRRLPATSLVNVNVNWNNIFHHGIDAAFFMTNVTNRIYRTATGGYAQGSGFENVYLGPPRMFGFRLKYNFGT